MSDVAFGTTDVGNTVPVSGPVTDTELRATPVPVSGPLTDTQLRASAVPVSLIGGTLNNGTVTTVTNVATQIAPANSTRKLLIIQSQSAGVVAIGSSGVTSTTGFTISSNGSYTFTSPNCPTNAIFAIRTTNGSTSIFVQEVV